MKLTKSFVLGSFAMVAMGLTTACSNDQSLNGPQEIADRLVFGNGSNLITLSIESEGALGTRGDESNHISDGTKADVLIFAVYEKKSDGSFILAPEFSKQTGDDIGNVILGAGQNAINTGNNWPLKIQLATNPDKTYQVAFWAQNKQCDTYNTADLTNVQVLYPDAMENNVVGASADFYLNNYEGRDAFCATAEIVGSQKETKCITLRRPFAQINVGTSGADYKNYLYGKRVFPNRTIQYSQITVEGVASKMNVVTDEIDSKNLTDVTFTYNRLPAYFNKDIFTSLPTVGEGKGAFADLLVAQGEEFLKVKLNKNNKEPLPYRTSYPTVSYNEDGTPYYRTETFKYMSMCYVLVPAARNASAADDAIDKYESSTVGKVKVYFAENADGNNGYNYVNIDNVPVHRNWRTNIIGGLAWIKDQTPDDPEDPNEPEDPKDPDDPWQPDPEDPDDPTPTPPDDPNDPTTIFNFSTLCIHLDPIYTGEWNHANGNTVTGENGESKTEWVENKFPGDLNGEYDERMHDDDDSEDVDDDNKFGGDDNNGEYQQPEGNPEETPETPEAAE